VENQHIPNSSDAIEGKSTASTQKMNEQVAEVNRADEDTSERMKWKYYYISNYCFQDFQTYDKGPFLSLLLLY